MIESGNPLPQLRCFVPGDRAVHLGEVAPGDHLVIYVGGAGVAPASLDAAVRWPLPTLPRTAFLVVDHESTFQGFIRTHTIEDVAFVVRRAIDPPEGIIRAVVVGPDREVTAIIDDVNVVALRSRVSLALQLSRTASYRDPIALHVDDSAWANRFMVLADRAEMILSPLVVRVEHVGSTAVQGLPARPTVDIALALLADEHRSEAIERLVGIGYAYVGDLGVYGRDLLHGPVDEPSHHLHVFTDTSPRLREFLAFRDALRSDRSLAVGYGHAKRDTARLRGSEYESAKRSFF